MKNKSLKNKKYRNKYLYNIMATGLAEQVKFNRKARGMTMLMLSKASKVSLRDLKAIERRRPNNITIAMLVGIANAFDCAFDIRFKSTVDTLREDREKFDVHVVSGFDYEMGDSKESKDAKNVS